MTKMERIQKMETLMEELGIHLYEISKDDSQGIIDSAKVYDDMLSMIDEIKLSIELGITKD